MDKVFSIAIDGPAGAGKSTLAKQLAKKMNIMYMDTGAMYRAIGLYITRSGISLDDAAAIAEKAENAPIDVRFENGVQRMFLGEEDVSQAIRSAEASMAASAVSAVPRVREILVDLQRRLAKGQSVVMDGRDIGTHVLPDATLKIFLTADARERAMRRHAELKEKGVDEPFEKVYEEMLQRDYQDSHRAASPLRQAEDAVGLDNTQLSLDETVQKITEIFHERMQNLQ